ncbi:DUF2808 domain-containing protein [Microcoleus sp. FACHB-672]|uniref:DUF2808 domain-containing protein n=1 Tax=Microcoleus sp. FACHB-672 TaxID=2692825 RepID=UPI0016847BC4|nr:DUF2808 domain-containing protein [Microcoleus sp. FACHB-672]MBD2040259.1 DUF2808 domain-containing protein [Microcoleus sp. FACHB-672]
MVFKVASTRRFLSAIAITGCLFTGLPHLSSLAQGLPGLTLFGGPKQENQLNFRLDYGAAGAWDRYRLRIGAKKLDLAVSQFAINYPDHYEGSFDKKAVKVIVDKKEIPLQDVVWDKENYLIEIFPQDPIPAGNNVEIVLSNVQNPTRRGMYYFNCRIISPGDVPLLRYLGTWVLTIS